MQSYKCAADLLIVMDATSSTQSYINQFKQHALSMYDEIILTLKEKARIIDEMRVKVIVFRDLYVDQEKAIEESQDKLSLNKEDFTAIETLGKMQENTKLS